MRLWSTAAWTSALALTMVFSATGAFAQDGDLAAARELYASASYDDALTMLNRLRSADHPVGQSRAIEQYRAFCLLALGRAADAQQAIEAVVAAEPSYGPDENEVSPRVRLAFAEVRRRMLPAIIQQKYAEAKTAFDRKDFKVAANLFSQVLVGLADPAVSAEAMLPPLSDLRMLAVGFEELSAKAAAPPPPPLPAPPVAVAAPPPPLPSPYRVYSGDDRNVVPPSVVKQVLPSFPGSVMAPRIGILEVLINESGEVESAVMTQSVTATYDRLVLTAAKDWRFKAAIVNGVPVKYRKVVQININRGT
jgi:TonB family protein